MNKSRTRVRRTDEQWRGLIRELEDSGVDRRTFCQRKGFSMEALRRAQHRLARRAAPAPFVELMPPDRPISAMSRDWDLELELGDGVVLRLARR